MNVILLFATLLLTVAYMAVDVQVSGKLNVLKNVAMGAAYFIFAFMIVSLTLFSVDYYSVWLTYLIVGVIAVIANGTVFMRKYKTLTALSSIGIEKYFPLGLLLVVVIALLFTFQKFGIYGMGQDQGVYQQEALLMANGLTDKAVTIKEYELLTDDKDKTAFMQLVQDQRMSAAGAYIIANNENRGTIEPGTYPVNSFVFHGLPNLPALLSIAGMIFGEEHIMLGLTPPFLIAVVLLFIILNLNLKLSKVTSTFITTMFVVSPLVLWTSKASLTEIFLAMIIIVLLYYLTSNSTNASSHLWVPIAAFAFFHVSIYTIMPMFVLLYIGLTIYRRDFGAWLSGVLSVVFYLLGFLAMAFAEPQYTFDNYISLAKIFNIIGLHVGANSTINVLIYITVIVALIIFAFLYYLIFIKKKTMPDISRHIPKILGRAVGILLVVLIYRVFNIATTVPQDNNVFTYFEGKGIISLLPNINLITFGFGSGGILLVILTVLLLFRDKRLHVAATLPITFMFLYCVIFMSVCLRLTTPYYYYYSRYDVPYIAIILILGAIVLDSFKSNSVKVIVALISIMLMLPFSSQLIMNKDISNIDFKSYKMVMETVRGLKPGSIVIMDEDMRSFFYHPISSTSDCYAFPVNFIENLASNDLLKNHDVYYLSSNNDTDALVITKSKNSLTDSRNGAYRPNGLDNLLSFEKGQTNISLKSTDVNSLLLYDNIFNMDKIEISKRTALTVPISMFSSQVGKIEGDSIVSDGSKSGSVMYGPYGKLEPGTYKFEMDLTLLNQDDASGEIGFCDIANDQGKESYGKVILKTSDFVDGKYMISILINTEIELDKFELRVFINQGVKLRVENVEFAIAD
ncbi:MAG: hypothetical protein WCD89_09040 [Anaerocolumna sp.]